MWVFDATPLIYLAKVEELAILGALDGPHLIPAPVHREVVEIGIEEGHPDARRIERLVERGLFSVVDVDETETYARLLENDSLSRADASVLACADRRGGVAVMDESYGRDVAAVEDIETRGTAYLVVSLLKEGVIDPGRAREIIDATVDAGWYCAPDVYAKVVQKIESLGE